MKRSLFTAAATAALLATAATGQAATTAANLPAGNQWDLATLKEYIPGLDAVGFRRLDSNADGYVSRTELDAAASARRPGTAAAKVAGADGNLDKLPAGNEWSRATLAPYLPGLDQATFQALDANGNGRLSRSELEAASEMGAGEMTGSVRIADFSLARLPAGDHWSLQTLDEIYPAINSAVFQAIDENGDGQASRSELEAALANGTIVAS